jgi:CBS domain-containing protein
LKRSPPRAAPRLRRSEPMVARVKEFMSHSPCTCSLQDTAEAAARLMWTHDCGIVPVVDTDGHLTGVVTDRDICMASYLRCSRLADIPIETCMSREITSCRADDELVWAEHLMGSKQVHRLPVVDERGVPVGLLSISDLARHIGSSHNGRRRGDPAEALVQTVAAIVTPRAAIQMH